MAAQAKENSNSDLEPMEIDDEFDEFLAEDAIDLEIDSVEFFDAYCPSCNAVKPHIVAKDASQRIVCAECNHKHSRHNDADAETKKHSRSLISPEESQSEEGLHKAWLRLTQNADTQNVPKYSIHIQPQVAELIEHKSFGIGVVCETLDAGKMEVLFQDRMRKLVCCR